MIDSVLKGTGNSRFLKSAVPAGTSWADALAMLQAGTFPIDFNGINAEGFQQVGTPLNKANLLKDATAAQIGLPPSTTPDGMFQALGNTGELHVWRKTVTTAQEIPAGYTLESAKETLISTRAEYGSGTQRIIVEYASSCSVSESGDPYLVNSSSAILEATSSTAITSLNNLKGKFLKFSKDSSYQYVTVADGLFFIPSDATFRLESSPYRIFVDKAQKVTGYPLTPAVTAVTYPVSTNRNAYQEGNDAKPAGYTLGDVVTGDFILGQANAETGYIFYKASSPTVSDDGTIELDKSHSILIFHTQNWTASTLQAAIRGQFLQRGNFMDVPSSYVPAGTIYIPNDAVVTQSNYTYIVSKYQPVTGYAATPAGTTIEYLGKLGDKARVQVVSYVGTGTYGESNPNSLTFDFVPKVVVLLGVVDPNGNLSSIHAWDTNYIDIRIPSITPTSFTAYYGFGQTSYASYQFGRVSTDRKTFYWYGSKSAFSQLNESGYIYYYLGVG